MCKFTAALLCCGWSENERGRLCAQRREGRLAKLATAGRVPASHDPFNALLPFLSLATRAPGLLGGAGAGLAAITTRPHVYLCGQKAQLENLFQTSSLRQQVTPPRNNHWVRITAIA